MAPATLWAALAVGLQLWASGHAVPAQVTVTPSPSEPGGACQLEEYYDARAQRCCRKCPPGQHVKAFCTQTSDTVCAPCEDSTYTQLWNQVAKCFSCGARCSTNQVEIQACTRKQNRICTCGRGWYCMLGRQEGCRLCAPLRKCRPGFGVAKQGTAAWDVVCAPCTPGTFSDTTSSTDTCRPHRTCHLVAVPGNASADAVCASVSPPPRVALGAARTPRPASMTSQHVGPTPGPSTEPSFLLPMGPSPPTEGLRTDSISLPVGLIVGVTVLGLLMIGLVNIVILSQKKRKLPCLQREAKAPHLPADKARSAPGLEQQHLLTTAPSSSSSSLESSASATDRRAPTRNQPAAPGVEKAPGSGEAQASCTGPESSPGGHGTQVNVTCIVNVYSGSDHGSPCASQASSMGEDTDTSPVVDEQVPFSKEECPLQSHLGASETLLQSPEKSLPLRMPDAVGKPS
ncbi:tumor necrosis factor receptor superfamily member 1B [Lepus europaeus]|uniref:tumor necrosis factor receptor superfamily member 1B n=1 Tax=Lepus europaeus TaxID=9983 RepID=UPI002B45DC31|nr:tumor necrosis factor receptor superfamily member 1B [Lepus europaeus]